MHLSSKYKSLTEDVGQQWKRENKHILQSDIALKVDPSNAEATFVQEIHLNPVVLVFI